MSKSPVLPGIIFIVSIAVIVLTLFPSKLKNCIDINIKVLDEMKKDKKEEKLIREKGKKITNECKNDYNFIISVN
jgi:hypothetical protein|tara:strand:+ start:540 stop:764 length:225 start_codon:yes stop_codon:yes gene_type:complete